MNICSTCGCTKSLALAHAKALGLLQELQHGIYNCCQIATWADEQWLAWFEATNEDDKSVEKVTKGPDFTEAETVLVPVRGRQCQVHFRDPDGLSR
ncbi:MAG: hypothetical protein JO210_10625 [Acidobacteriaceae bacterium]|nr:hypothetical protein [Acidobacteriaceae bacterium]